MKRELSKRRLAMFITAMALAFVTLGVFCPVKFAIGDLRVEKELTRIASTNDAWDQGFTQTGWDGPTGTYSSGDIRAFRAGNWLWRLDIYSEGPEKSL